MEIDLAKPRKPLTVFSLVMITVISVDSIRNLPAASLFGSALIFFYLLGAVFFLFPSALVSAELASSWPKQGGVYVWIKHAFGRKAGLFAIWLQWIENVIWYPTILSFVGGTIGYLINPQLAENKYFLVSIILASFWLATFINLYGMKSSAWFSTVCAIFGLMIPMSLIITLGVLWIIKGHPAQVSFHPAKMLPHITRANTWVSLTGIILSFCGMEIATVHARDVNNPQRSFPLALLYSAGIIICTLMFGALAIAIVLPTDKISLVTGIMQAYDQFFMQYNLDWMLPIVGIMLVLGGMGSVSNWIVSPTKGLLVAMEELHMPKIFMYENKHGAPTVLLIIQAVIVTVLTSIFLLIPTVNGSYWYLTALAAQLYMIMYIMLFMACIALRYKEPNHERPYHIPWKNYGVWIVAGLGIIGSLVTFTVGFIPPEQIEAGNLTYYRTLIITGLIVMALPPFFFPKAKHLLGA